MARIDKIDRRTDVVFLVFSYAEAIEGVTKLQKLLFLIEQETEFFQAYENDIAFEFAPYKMGPFSKHVYEELEFLLSLDAIETEPLPGADPNPTDSEFAEQRFTITAKGEKIAAQLESQLEPEYCDELSDTVTTYNSLELQDLLKYVYTEYPEYAADSEIIDELEIEMAAE
ncbi:DUF4065 domain-containing protein (plasmid) [Halorientalis pallida]|uniref:DUF4065 domain-containing protein n=1 Tax=Halorientalis pallida TaxID=2479928 RepID=UPI003C6ECB36